MVISENCCTFIALNYRVVQTIIAMSFPPVRRRRNTEDKVTEIFFMADKYHKVFCCMLEKYSLNAPKIAGKRSYQGTEYEASINYEDCKCICHQLKFLK